MIPTPINCLTKAIPQVENDTYRNLLINQLDYINNHREELFRKINFFVMMYNNGKLKKIEGRCCNFRLLEEKCLEYSTLIGV